LTPEPDILSLFPIALALLIAVGSRNVILGLFVGLFVGVLMLEGVAPLAGMGVLVKQHLVPQITDSYNAGVLVLLGFIGGFVALMEGSGGGAAFAERVTRYLTTRLRLQLAAWLGGIMIFFSDLGTPLIVGPTFRPLADRLKVSRVKLAYIVDSTAAPVAILVPFIGWGVYIMSLLEQQFQTLGVEQSDFAALIAALPYQLYAWLAILLVPLLALTGVEVGPMRRHEAFARAGGGATAAIPADREGSAGNLPPTLAVEAQGRARASFIWLPLLVLGAVLAWMLVPLGFPFGRVSGADFRAGLSTAYVAAALALMMLMAFHGARRVLDSVQLYLAGMSRMMQVAVMLILAWALGDLNHLLGADSYIATLAAEHVASWSLPVLIFALSGIISFATGSSWGTFAIMFPLALPAAVVSGADVSVCIGAVLSGGLFGDHSSPISETTILSATGAGSDAFEHFQTQLPYALANGLLCVLGFVVAGISPQTWIILVLLLAQIALVLLIRRAQKPESRSS